MTDYLDIIDKDLEKAKKIAENDFLMCNFLGDYYLKKNNFSQSEFWLTKSVSLNPNNFTTYNLLGSIFFKQKIFDTAAEFYEKSLSINPNNIHALCDMGVIEKLRENKEKTLELYEKALKTDPDGEIINANLAVLFCEQGDYEKGKHHYEKSLKSNPNNKKVLFNYSLLQLMLGDYENGFENYENRIWTVDKPPGISWNGEENQKIMIVSEQGYGDIIQFVRFIPLVKKISKKVTLLCPKSLLSILSTLEGVDEILEFNEEDSFIEVEKTEQSDGENHSYPYNYYSRLLSLPRILQINDFSKIPNEKYLKTDPEKNKKWKKIINSNKYKVGLVWEGSKRENDLELKIIRKKTNIDFSQIKELLELDNIEFYSLQKDFEVTNEKIINLNSYLEDFSETASAIENLDLVISVDTSIIHLAGALRKPVWLLSRKNGCWRWSTEGETSHWYPTLKIFRQENENNWDSVIKKVKNCLSSL